MMPYNDGDYYGRRPHPNYRSQHRFHGSEDYPVPLSKSDEDDLELMFTGGSPPWTHFDTFLRRALMVGGCVLVYAALIAAVIFVIDISVPDNPSPSQTPLLNTDKPLFSRPPEVPK